MKAVIALLLILVFTGVGGALGLFLKPAGPAGDHAAGPPDATDGPAPDSAIGLEGERPPPSYVKISRQIIVPVVEGGTTRALMVFEIALDVPAQHREAVFEREPRIRDAFLRELFEMSYTGAFLETYTSDRVMEELRQKLLAAARLHLGTRITDVLILDALRQEMAPHSQ
ncbi:hypothetical protein LNKW23_28510 [Paralimibaculum aggregatum]|uniref:Flagellar protein FliL n=1 Tax=Paralimibaculum aggregatum TaxID=3036245 RepID=A0ABQ6LQ91_9RHOB|nr:flagellar basal body-associated FliL family protein [Limibaculum sp. NKW23]GMG83638.1 hypothetical protein LNKW23_28510 [Limibaculum sp. NKW23]